MAVDGAELETPWWICVTALLLLKHTFNSLLNTTSTSGGCGRPELVACQQLLLGPFKKGVPNDLDPAFGAGSANDILSKTYHRGIIYSRDVLNTYRDDFYTSRYEG